MAFMVPAVMYTLYGRAAELLVTGFVGDLLLPLRGNQSFD